MVSSEVVSRLHAVSLGYPVLGESVYSDHEKFYNPAVSVPGDVASPILHDWISPCGTILSPDRISRLLIDFDREDIQSSESIVYKSIEKQLSVFPGENSLCQWLNHPKSVHIRGDRVRNIR